MKTTPRRLFAADEPAIHGLSSPEPRTAAGGREAPAAPLLGSAETAGDDRKGAVGLPAAMAPFRDVPRGVWTVYLSAWAALFGLFALFFAVNLASAFAVTISCLFAVMAFGLPIVLAGLPKDSDGECGPMIDTHTGSLSIAAAGAQIVLIPVAAVIGLSAFILLAK